MTFTLTLWKRISLQLICGGLTAQDPEPFHQYGPDSAVTHRQTHTLQPDRSAAGGRGVH